MLKKRIIAALMALLLLLGTGTNITEAYAEEETCYLPLINIGGSAQFRNSFCSRDGDQTPKA